MITLEDFSLFLKDFFRIEFSKEEEDKIIYSFKINSEDVEFIVQKERLTSLFSDYNSFELSDDSILLSKNSIEFLISFESARPMLSYSLFRDKASIVLEDKTNDLKYEIGLPSDVYLIHTLVMFKKYNIYKSMPRGIMFTRMARGYEKGTIDLIGFLKTILPRFYSLRIFSGTKRIKSELEELSQACLFHLGYNLNLPVVMIKSTEEFYGSDKILRLRRSRPDELDPPRRKYTMSLISHYQLAISTDSAPLQYLSFYHIIEHFYELVFNEDLINTLKNEITKPDFSYNRKKDITKVIDIIKKRLKVRADEFIFDELDALKLTLKKHFNNFEKVNEELVLYDKELINYYKTNKVSFSEGNTVNLESDNIDEIYSNLAKRIYLTRNSIVHSKEGNKPKFVPFQHEKELWKEIPLIRFMSEEIIINNSRLID